MATSTSKANSMAELMARQTSQFQPLKRGDIVTGTVKKLTPREILLDIGYKSDALVIEYDKQNLENLLSLLKVGDTVKASVISPESEEGFPVLSLRLVFLLVNARVACVDVWLHTAFNKHKRAFF